jgi:hypothetical protein
LKNCGRTPQGVLLENWPLLCDKQPMTIEQLRERLVQAEPFILRLSDGRKIEVPHPDFIAVGGNVAVVVDANGLSKKIDAHHIVSIEDAPARHRRKSSAG